MSLAVPEDAASVLEQFVHDVANIPAEISHLLEEIQAKDTQIQAYHKEIIKWDHQLQKWVHANGGHVRNPKEETFSKRINDTYNKCEILQAEKLGLSEKAMIVLDRQVKRLDIGLRGLMQTEQFPADWNGPSLLNASPDGASSVDTVKKSSAAADGLSGPFAGARPLQAVSGNIVSSPAGAPNFAQAAQMRLAQSASATGSRASTGGSSTPSNLPRSQREGSSEANKRRRLNSSLNIPPSASALRQSSLGPGTPKAGTPGPSTVINSSRAGSAQPTRPSKTDPKKAPAVAAPPRKVAPPPSKKGQRSRPAGTKKSDRRRQLVRDRATPSTNASASGSEDDDSSSPTPSSLPRSQIDGSGDTKADDDDGDDDQLYCLCQKVSFGDMVGCDNDNCQYQWFHYKCVGVTEEPVGEWLCPMCRGLPRSKLRITKD